MQQNQAKSRAFNARRTDQARTKPMILVVEDDVGHGVMLRVVLGLKGYDVVQAVNGLQAVELAITSLPDLILLDLDLPLLNGLAVTRNLRRHPKLRQIPIVVVSGYDCETSALEAGCDDYLVKPVDFDRLDEILNSNVPLAVDSDYM